MSARALYPELAACGMNVRTGAVRGSLPKDEAGALLGHVRSNRAGLREVLQDRRDPNLEALRREGGAA